MFVEMQNLAHAPLTALFPSLFCTFHFARITFQGTGGGKKIPPLPALKGVRKRYTYIPFQNTFIPYRPPDMGL
jgi:hypothetical protein